MMFCDAKKNHSEASTLFCKCLANMDLVNPHSLKRGCFVREGKTTCCIGIIAKNQPFTMIDAQMLLTILVLSKD